MNEYLIPAVVARQFMPNQSPAHLTLLGNGLINDTYLVAHQNFQWVLQRINRQVFPEPLLLLDNLQQLIDHAASKSDTPNLLQIPKLFHAPDRQFCVIDAEGNYWRALEFIPNSYSKEQCEHLKDAEQIGRALGYFHALCSDLEPDRLHDTLPGFHIAPNYYQAYLQALSSAENIPGDDAYRFCVSYIEQRESVINVLETAKHSGQLKLRVMHGDPKVNNFLFDRERECVISLIDLDTVKPGLIHYDLGDCLRSACFDKEAAEMFNVELCEAILKSYLAEAEHFFADADYDYLYPAIQLIPLELGIRFFCDYLLGNRYFKVTEPLQNLHRAVQQFQLCSSIERQGNSLSQVIRRLR